MAIAPATGAAVVAAPLPLKDLVVEINAKDDVFKGTLDLTPTLQAKPSVLVETVKGKATTTTVKVTADERKLALAIQQALKGVDLAKAGFKPFSGKPVDVGTIRVAVDTLEVRWPQGKATGTTADFVKVLAPPFNKYVDTAIPPKPAPPTPPPAPAPKPPKA